MRRTLGAFAIVVALGACGGGDGDVSGRAQETLEPHIAELRLAAGNRDADQLQTDLEELRVAVDVLEAEGELTESGAATIRRQADVIEQQRSLITTTTTAVRRSTPTAAVRSDPTDGDGPGTEGGRGKGGKKNDDDD